MTLYRKLLLLTGCLLLTAHSVFAEENIITKFTTSTFNEILVVDKLPKVMKSYLEKRIDNGIAPIGGKFRATDTVFDPSLPTRRLKLAGYRDNVWFIWYEHGGIGFHQHLVIFNISNGQLELLYTARPFANNLNELKQKLASGTVKDETLVANKHGYW